MDNFSYWYRGKNTVYFIANASCLDANVFEEINTKTELLLENAKLEDSHIKGINITFNTTKFTKSKDCFEDWIICGHQSLSFGFVKFLVTVHFEGGPYGPCTISLPAYINTQWYLSELHAQILKREIIQSFF